MAGWLEIQKGHTYDWHLMGGAKMYTKNVECSIGIISLSLILGYQEPLLYSHVISLP